jgi:uncharacterized protein (TIRG00374 family)
VDWQEVFLLIRDIQLKYIVVYYLFLVLGILVSSYKWKLLARFKGIDFSLAQFFRWYLTGTFINNFMPSFVGGDTYRIYQAGKKNQYAKSAAAVAMDRMTGLLGAMFLIVIFAMSNYAMVFEKKILLWINGVVIVSVAALWLIYITRKSLIWKKLLHSKIARIFPRKVGEFATEGWHYFQNRRMMTQSMGLSIIFNLIGLAASNYVLFIALGENMDMLNYLSVIFLVSFVSAVPISINNIGVKEWAYVTFFGFFGVPSSVVVTVAILSRLLQMLLSFLAWPMYLRDRS